MPDLPKATLFAAFMWDCQACGIENFCRAVRAEMTSEEAHQAAIEDGQVEPWETLPEGATGYMIAVPLKVTCKDCGVEYEACDEMAEGYDGQS